MLETFALRLAVGMLLALLVLPMAEVPPRFFRIHLLIALALLTLAGLAGWSNEATAFWLGLGLAGAGCFLGTWFWLGEANILGIAAIVMAALAASLSLTMGLAQTSSWLWLLLDHGSAAAQLGLVLTAMLLGHYYLITPGMSARPLVRLTVLLMVAIGWRAGVTVANAWTGQHLPFAGERGWWLGLRGLAGILAAAVFAVLAWRCARIRSTQSATGILYAAVISTFLGELAQLLLDQAS
jgi:hypothetical protein